MTSTTNETTNGVHVGNLINTVHAIQRQPKLAALKLRVQNKWATGPRSTATLDSFFGLCQEMHHEHPLEIYSDEPAVVLGTDTAPNPAEIALAGLSACMTTTLAYKAAGMGVELESVESEYEGDVDLQGFLELNPETEIGYTEVRVKFKVKGDLDEATIEEMLKKSPVYNTFTKPVKVKILVEKV